MSAASHETLYRREGDHWLLELRLREVRQLFNTFDPAPFHEKDLDDDAARYIVESAREIPGSAPLRLVVWLPTDEFHSPHAQQLATAVRTFFTYEALRTTNELRLLLKHGRIALVVGLLFLVVCETIRGWLAGSPGSPLQPLNEGLAIIGWVAMWRPLQVFLYDWWPVAQRRRLLQRLADADIQLRDAGTSAGSAPG
ncbi:MAG: hypothetical protein AB7K09_02180 [Planctomycetota bacterium]